MRVTLVLWSFTEQVECIEGVQPADQKACANNSHAKIYNGT